MRLFGGTELVLQLTLESAPASGTVLLPVLVVLLLLVVLVVLVKVLGACVQNERLRHARCSRGAQSGCWFSCVQDCMECICALWQFISVVFDALLF